MDDLVVVEANSMDFLVTDLVVLNKKEKVPPHYVVVEPAITEGGLLSYSKRYLAYSRKIPNPRLGRVAITDVRVIGSSDRSPYGYRLLSSTLDDNSKPFSSKVIALKVDPLEQVTQAVTDLVVLSGSKKDQVPSGYFRLPEINGYSICYKVSRLEKGGGGGGGTQASEANKQQPQPSPASTTPNTAQRKPKTAIDGLTFKLGDAQGGSQHLSNSCIDTNKVSNGTEVPGGNFDGREHYSADLGLGLLTLDDIEDKFQFDWGLAEEQLAQQS